MDQDIKGRLYICSTPIGNIEDITLRVLRILKEVDLIAAEDTRITKKLLAFYDIHNPIISFNQVNEKKVILKLTDRLLQGKKIALVSDAGTPGIQDPGHTLIKKCIELGIDYESLPGPSALIAAAIISGLPTNDLRFLGFLPRKTGQRKKLLTDLKDEKSTLIFYESPHRITNSLKDIEDVFGSRKVALLREITKKFEERLFGSSKEIQKEIGDKKIKGEIVLVIKGADSKSETVTAEEIRNDLTSLLKQGLTKKDSVKKVASIRGVPRKRVYEESLDI